MKKPTWREKLAHLGPGDVVFYLFLAWFVFAFIIFPNVSTIVGVVYQNGSFTTNAFRKLFSSARAIRSLSNSFILAVSMCITVNVVGTLLVLFTDYFAIRGARVLRWIYMSTLVYSGIVLCSGYKYVYSANGMITRFITQLFPSVDPNWFTGYGAVIFIMTFACTSNHMIFLGNAIRGIDYQTVEAAKNMGASFPTIFARIVFPALKPNFFALTILTFLTGLSAMSAPLLVGGLSFQTINPMIIAFAQTTVSRDISTLLAIILGVATVIILMFSSSLERGGNYISVSKVKSRLVKEKIHNPFANLLAHGVAYALGLIYAAPILLVVLYSFADYQAIMSGVITFENLTLDNYRLLFTMASAFRPYLISICYSVAAAVLVTALVTVETRLAQRIRGAWSTFIEFSMLIPWFLPTTLIALGLMITYGVPRLVVGNKVLIGTTAILLVGYIVSKIPFSLRMVKAAFFSVDHHLEEAARSMGAKPSYTFRKVILPILMPVLISVSALNFTTLMAEYEMTVFLFHPLLQPLGPVIKSANDDTASLQMKAMIFVYSVLLMIVSTIALVIAGRLQNRDAGRKRTP